MCEYTDHGHCGILRDVDGEQVLDNARTLERLASIALAYARAGAHMVCPSDMMDNRVGAIRKIFNDNGFEHVSIMAYTSKKASVMYAPFRDAVESTFQGDRKRYQHPVGSTSHAALAFERDVLQGADSVIVKPSLFYSDIVASFAAKKTVPVVCYLVSGEYKMVKDYGDSTNSLESVVREAHLGLLRAGASVLVTLFLSNGASPSLTSDCMAPAYHESPRHLGTMEAQQLTDKIVAVVLQPGYVKTDLTHHNGVVLPEDSVAGMAKVISGLTLDDTAKFFDFQGPELPW
ncbi:hypothetical protein ON010_g18758 [Phytophthora cinnamomi]|nr:hypothetical protein ON010_g18758 [Phytophthora cinnamomi]